MELQAKHLTLRTLPFICSVTITHTVNVGYLQILNTYHSHTVYRGSRYHVRNVPHTNNIKTTSHAKKKKSPIRNRR